LWGLDHKVSQALACQQQLWQSGARAEAAAGADVGSIDTMHGMPSFI
jgi:hypothetical protein